MFKQLSGIIIVSFLMSQAVTAQTPPKVDSQTETSKTKTKPKPKAPDKTKEKTKKKDIDTFFRDAEKQMEDGPSCQPPPDPIV